jgi:hypothetical protein
MGLDYAHEKLMSAVDVLARGAGRIQERLYSAFLSFHTLRTDEDFPEDLRADYARLHTALTNPKTPEPDIDRAREMGNAKIACEQMSDQEGRDLADLILHLDFEVRTRLAAIRHQN